jgi:hypothetical protein
MPPTSLKSPGRASVLSSSIRLAENILRKSCLQIDTPVARALR